MLSQTSPLTYAHLGSHVCKSTHTEAHMSAEKKNPPAWRGLSSLNIQEPKEDFLVSKWFHHSAALLQDIAIRRESIYLEPRQGGRETEADLSPLLPCLSLSRCPGVCTPMSLSGSWGSSEPQFLSSESLQPSGQCHGHQKHLIGGLPWWSSS